MPNPKPSSDITMPLRRLGPDMPEVGAIGFGAMALSNPERPSETEAVAVIHAALDRGVTYLDTADIYGPEDADVGHNERLVAKALRSWGGRREGVIVGTKGGYTKQRGQLVPDGRPSHLTAACERSLRALGVDALDLYQLHMPDPAVPFSESVGALESLRAQGKVRWVGLSNVTVAQIGAARAAAPIQCVQNPLSILQRASATVGPVAKLELRGARGVRQLRRLVGEPFHSGVLALCERLGLGFIAYSPLGGGRRHELASHRRLEQAARDHGVSVYAMAIAWVLARSPQTIPIPSARSTEHLLDALRAAGVRIGEDALSSLGG